MSFHVFNGRGVSPKGVCEGMTWTDESTHINIGPCPNPDMNVGSTDTKIDTYTKIKINKFLQHKTKLSVDIELKVAAIQCGRHHHLLGKLSYLGFIEQLINHLPNTDVVYKTGYAPARRVAARHLGQPRVVDTLALYEAVTVLEERIARNITKPNPPQPPSTQQGKRRKRKPRGMSEGPEVIKRAKHKNSPLTLNQGVEDFTNGILEMV